MAKSASAANMGGVVFKSLVGGQAACSAVQEEVNRWAEAEGVRPITCWWGAMAERDFTAEGVRAAVEEGAKVVWLPVICSAHSLHRVGAPKRVLDDVEGIADDVPWPMPWDEALRRGKYLLDEHGRLKPMVREMVRIVADHGAALSFAHSSKPEMEALAEECGRLNYRQAFIDHPYGPQVGLEFEDLKPFADAGLVFNFTYDEISPLLGVDPFRMYQAIRAVGPEHCTLSSDAGEPLFPNSVECMRLMRAYMRAFGLTEDELKLMTTTTPARLCGEE
jgi:hypothetical protein